MSDIIGTCCSTIAGFGRSQRCGKKAKVERAGKLYCGVHDPERRQAIRAKSEERWRAESEARRIEWKRQAAGHEVIRLARAAARQEASWDDVAAAVAAMDAIGGEP